MPSLISPLRKLRRTSLAFFHNRDVDLNFRAFGVAFVVHFSFGKFIAGTGEPGTIDILPGSLNSLRKLWYLRTLNGWNREHSIRRLWDLSTKHLWRDTFVIMDFHSNHIGKLAGRALWRKA